jgi:hypothetical protein
MVIPYVHGLFLLIPGPDERVKQHNRLRQSQLSPLNPVDQSARTAVTSTSTLNSGRVKPETITSVEAKALPET